MRANIKRKALILTMIMLSFQTHIIKSSSAKEPANTHQIDRYDKPRQEIEYGVYLLGFSIGKANLITVMTNDTYALILKARLSGLAGLVTGGKGEASSKGKIDKQSPSATSFSLTANSMSETREINLLLKDQKIIERSMTPPLEPKPDRIEVKETDLNKVIDPLSALIMPTANPADPENCNRTLSLYDGATRFDLKLTYTETKPIEIEGYKGNVLVCNVRYQPIAGHRPTRKAIKFMIENKNIFVSLAPANNGNMVIPLSISIKTTLGTLLIKAKTWQVKQDDALEDQ